MSSFKRNLLLTIISISLLTAAKLFAETTPTEPPIGTVWLYQGSNYSGTKIVYDNDAALINELNDQFSSIKVGPGTIVILFKEDGYRGNSLKLDHHLAELAAEDFDNSVSSIKVEPNKGHIWLYEDTGFRGDRIVLYENTNVLGKRNFDFDNKASSVKVGYATTAVFYKDNDYQGRGDPLELNATDSRLDSIFDDNISSVEVEVTQ